MPLDKLAQMPPTDVNVTPSALIDLMTALWLGFIGACVGSFLNVVAYRLPLGMSVIWNPSHCPKCSHPIRAYDNVPVLGWLWLKGKCRDCGESISPRYAIVEFVMGLAFFVLAYVELFSGGANLPGGPLTEFIGAADNVWVPQWRLIAVYAYHGLLLSLLMSTTLIDLDGKRVPKSLLWLGVIVSLALSLLGVRSWIGLHERAVSGWGNLAALEGAVWGAVVGIVAAAAIAAVWGFLMAADESVNEQRNLCQRMSARFYSGDPLLAACALTGLFLGVRLVGCAAIGTTAVWAIIAPLCSGRTGWKASLLASPLPVLFCVVVMLTSFFWNSN